MVLKLLSRLHSDQFSSEIPLCEMHLSPWNSLWLILEQQPCSFLNFCNTGLHTWHLVNWKLADQYIYIHTSNCSNITNFDTKGVLKMTRRESFYLGFRVLGEVTCHKDRIYDKIEKTITNFSWCMTSSRFSNNVIAAITLAMHVCWLLPCRYWSSIYPDIIWPHIIWPHCQI